VEPAGDDAENSDALPMALPKAVGSGELPAPEPSAEAIAHISVTTAIPEVATFVQDNRGPVAACLLVRSGLACLGWVRWRGPRTCLGRAFETTRRPCRLPKNEFWRQRQWRTSKALTNGAASSGCRRRPCAAASRCLLFTLVSISHSRVRRDGVNYLCHLDKRRAGGLGIDRIRERQHAEA
jgi:hypothetical protein